MDTRRLTLTTAVFVIIAVVVALTAPRLLRGGAAQLDLGGQPQLGDPSAAVEIVLFEDFRCPHCATFTETTFPQLRREFVDTGQARIYFVNFPVLGPESEAVARAGECVYRQSEPAFWDLKEALFRSQGELESERRVVELAETYAPDIDAEALRECMGSGEAREEVARDARAARALALTGTPSVTVNGVQVTNPGLEQIRVAVGRALPAAD